MASTEGDDDPNRSQRWDPNSSLRRIGTSVELAIENWNSFLRRYNKEDVASQDLRPFTLR